MSALDSRGLLPLCCYLSEQDAFETPQTIHFMGLSSYLGDGRLWRGRAGSVCFHAQLLLRQADREHWNVISTKSKDSTLVAVTHIWCLLMTKKKNRLFVVLTHSHFENTHCCLSTVFSLGVISKQAE